MSKTLKELESIVGIALFDRSGRRLVLNPAGRRFQKHAGTALTEILRAQEAARGTAARSRLALGALPTVAADLLPRAALRLAEARPGLVLRILTAPNWLLYSQLREGALDVVVGRAGDPGQMEGLGFDELYVEDVVLAVRAGHPLVDRPLATTGLADYPLLLPPRGARIHTAVTGWLLTHGLRDARATWESVSLAFGRGIVLRSDAVWFISRGVVAEELRTGSLTTLDARHPMLTGPVGISTRDSDETSPDLAALIEALHACAATPG